MNSYLFTVENQTSQKIKKWLFENNCPTASQSVKSTSNKVTFVVEGNVSACGFVSRMNELDFKFKVEPIGESQALPPITIAYY